MKYDEERGKCHTNTNTHSQHKNSTLFPSSKNRCCFTIAQNVHKIIYREIVHSAHGVEWKGEREREKHGKTIYCHRILC
jgi:hypothetical protein